MSICFHPSPWSFVKSVQFYSSNPSNLRLKSPASPACDEKNPERFMCLKTREINKAHCIKKGACLRLMIWLPSFFQSSHQGGSVFSRRKNWCSRTGVEPFCSHGCFQKSCFFPKWMVYQGTTLFFNGWFRGKTSIFGNTHMEADSIEDSIV